MTLIRRVTTATKDSFQNDAFGRARTSSPDTRLDIEFIYDKQAEFCDEITENGTVTHNNATRDLTLAISSTDSDTQATIKTIPVPYTPGNSQLIEISAVLNLAGLSGGATECFLRTSISGTPEETVYTQSTWVNEDGVASLRSGLDWSKSHLFMIDFQSLKVGRIRFGLSYQGIATQVMSVANDNLRSSGYWQVPSLPVYWKIYHSGAETIMETGYGDENNAVGFRHVIDTTISATMKAICATVKSEGGNPVRSAYGISKSISNGVTAKTVSTTLIPILSIRCASTFKTFDNLALVAPKSIKVQTDNSIRLVFIIEPTLTGAAWLPVDVNESVVEYDVASTAVTGGKAIGEDYVATGKNTEAAIRDVLGKAVMWHRKASTSGSSTKNGILTVAAVRSASDNASVLAAINWEELR